MPRYDFRCPTCGSEREVIAAWSEAVQLALVCTGCGDDMARTISAGAVLHGGRAGDAPAVSHDHRPGHSCGSCADAIRLNRPNPLVPDPASGSGADDA